MAGAAFSERTNEIRTPENRAEILRMFAPDDRWLDVIEKMGISEMSMRRWMELVSTFQSDCLKAKARAADFHLDVIDDHSIEAMVVRRFPDRAYNQDRSVVMDADVCAQLLSRTVAAGPRVTEVRSKSSLVKTDPAAIKSNIKQARATYFYG